MGYYMRYLIEEGRAISLDLIESALKQVDEDYRLAARSNANECADIMLGSDVYGELEINRRGSDLSSAGVAELVWLWRTSIMKSTSKCPKCCSTEIIADAKAIDRGHADSQKELSVATFGKPDALIFKEQHTSVLSAWVCGQCGYVEFYADSPSSLRIPRA